MTLFIAGAITCAPPSRSTTSGVPQLSISCRFVRHQLVSGQLVERGDERLPW
jgi:hypothetical protein